MFKPFDKPIEFLRVGTDSEMESRAMKDNKIEFSKKYGMLANKSRKDAKSKKCLYCGAGCSSFCNSHSIPAFILRNIAVDGDLYSNIKLINLPLLDEDKGVNQSGTFRIICNTCDSTIFSDYENPENYVDVPNSKMIAQIAMKNHLKNISKRKFEIALYDNINDNFDLQRDMIKQKQSINILDLNEFIEGFERAKRRAKKDWDNEYYLFYHQKIDYVVPIAYQGTVALLTDFEGNTINNIYNTSANYRIQSLHICVFPLENSSIIMMFTDSKDKRYRRFIKQFNKLSDEEKLSAVNFIIFTYSEDVFINKEVNEEVLNHKELVEASRKTPEILSTTIDFEALTIAKEEYDFSRMTEINRC